MAGKGRIKREGLDKAHNNPDASGQPASPCHAWGLPPRVVEGPARPGLRNRGVPGQAQTVGLAAGAQKPV